MKRGLENPSLIPVRAFEFDLIHINPVAGNGHILEMGP